jgi:mono/diheme cytochrome c family protein
MFGVPRPLIFIGILLGLLLLVPPAVVGRIRATTSQGRPIHVFWDMDMQPKFKPQSANPLFADGRAMRQPVAGSVAVGEADLDVTRTEGVAGDGWSEALPAGLKADTAFLARGQQRFNIYCAVCHGYAGFGDGLVNQRAMALMSNAAGPVQGTAWVAAKSVHDETVRSQPIGQIFHTITYGVRNMAGYASQISVDDRWAIAAYVKALQLSQDARPQDVPVERRADLAPPAAAPASGKP